MAHLLPVYNSRCHWILYVRDIPLWALQSMWYTYRDGRNLHKVRADASLPQTECQIRTCSLCLPHGLPSQDSVLRLATKCRLNALLPLYQYPDNLSVVFLQKVDRLPKQESHRKILPTDGVVFSAVDIVRFWVPDIHSLRGSFPSGNCKRYHMRWFLVSC